MKTLDFSHRYYLIPILMLLLLSITGCTSSSTTSTTLKSQAVVTPTSIITNTLGVGVVDSVSLQGIVSGWAIDPAMPAKTSIQVYYDAVKAAPTTYAASTLRADGRPGFQFTIPDQYWDGKSHTLTAYVMINGAPANLKNCPETFTLTKTAAPAPAPAPSPSPTSPVSTVPGINFWSSLPSTHVGSTVTLNWNTSNATSVSISPTTSFATPPTSFSLSGSLTATINSNVTFILTAVGPGGTSTAQVTVAGTQTLPPQIQFTPANITIAQGESVNLTWTTTNATSVSISPLSGMINAPQTLPTAGNVWVTTGQSTLYTLTATGPGGISTSTVQISILQFPVDSNIDSTSIYKSINASTIISLGSSGTFDLSNQNWIGFNNGGSPANFQFGSSGDVPFVYQDLNSGSLMVAIYRSSNGQFIIDKNNANSNSSSQTTVTIGQTGDVPMAVRLTVNGISGIHLGVFRPAEGNWYLIDNALAANPNIVAIALGSQGDIPFATDSAIGVFRPATGQFIYSASLNAFNPNQLTTLATGKVGAVPLSFSVVGGAANWTVSTKESLYLSGGNSSVSPLLRFLTSGTSLVWTPP